MTKDFRKIIDMYPTVGDMLDVIGLSRYHVEEIISKRNRINTYEVSDDLIIESIKADSVLLNKLVDNYNEHIKENSFLFDKQTMHELLFE